MLMLEPVITVPGLSNIAFHRDSEDPWQFYAIRGNVVIATDQNNLPAFSYTFYARDAKIAYETAEGEAPEYQLGSLMLTTSMALSEEESEGLQQNIEKQKQHV